jgi:hypothetical protein
VQVAYNFDRSGRLSVEATIPGVGREAKMELQRVRTLPNARLQQWKKVICEDGGYSAFEGIAQIIESALVESEPIESATEEPDIVVAAQAQMKNTSLDPFIAEGAPLAASEVLKRDLQSKRGARETNPSYHSQSRNNPLRSLTGHIIFSILGALIGLYVLSLINPKVVEYLPDWLAGIVR